MSEGGDFFAKTPQAAQNRGMRLRTRLAAGFFVAVCFSTLVGRLWYLQIHEYDFYAQRAAGQQLRDSVVPAPRGYSGRKRHPACGVCQLLDHPGSTPGDGG